MERDAKKRLLVLTAEIGKANGLRAGAEILLALIQGRKRIDASDLRAAAASMNATADKVESRTKIEMLALGASGGQP